MSLANFCLSLRDKPGLIEPKTRTGSRVWRFDNRILSDVSVNPKDKPDWYVEYDRIISRCYGAGGAGGMLAPDWHKASAFKEWWESTEDTSVEQVVTWNIVKPGNEQLEFSPDTGYFFPEEVKKFFMPPIIRRTELSWNGMLGVGRRFHMNNGYSARTQRIGGRSMMTYHATELEAHHAWLSARIDELDALIAKEYRERGREILESRRVRLLGALQNGLEVTFL